MLGRSGSAERQAELQLIEETRAKKCCASDCLNKFPVELIAACREQCRELQIRCNQHISHLHLVILGHMDACLHDGQQTSRSKQKNGDRTRTRLASTFHGVPVCIDAFHFLHDISRRVTRDLKQHFEQHGLEPKVHGNVYKTSLAKALPFEMRENAVKFIENYALTHALVLPGRTPGTKNPDILLLPCGTTKTKVYDLFVEACGDNSSMSYVMFCKMWKTFLPGVCIQRPRTDLCITCKQDTLSLQKLRALDDEARTDLLSRSLKHLEVVAQQRDHYKSSIADARATLPTSVSFGDTADASVVQHYSFDFAQQIFIPNSSQQVGPIYFLVPYKLALFGIMCEPLCKMVVYVIPEAVLVSKGSNMVISLLHHFLMKYGAGVASMVLNADNCVGQNKNNTVLQYLMWRVATGLSSSIELAFMVAGHTKFGPDYGFGILKRLYRHNDVNSVEEVCNLIGQSTLLIAEAAGTEQGDVLIPCYDWQAKFSALNKIAGIKQYHHFAYHCSKRGICLVRQYAQSPVTEIPVSWDDDTQLPPVIIPSGLSVVRQEYLFTKIRHFVADEFKDRVCPQPKAAAVSEEAAGTSAAAAVIDEPQVHVPCLATVAAKSTENTGRTLLASKCSISTRGHAAGLSAETVLGSKRAAPKCKYCGEPGHRNSVRGGKFSCPKRRLESAHAD